MKLPPVGTEVRLTWLDSGLHSFRTGTHPKDRRLSRFIARGVILAVTDEAVAIASETELGIDNYESATYDLIAINSIEELVILEPKRVKRKR